MGRPDIEKIWDDFLKDRSRQDLKEKIMLHYLPMVRIIAGRMMISLPNSVNIDDLISNGLIGLINAIDKFESEKGFKFETFANIKVRGALLDGLRELDWMPRGIREKNNLLKNAIRNAEKRVKRAPTDLEIAEELNLPMEKYFDLLNDVKVVSLMSLDTSLNSEDNTGKLLDVVEDKYATRPDEKLEREELKKILVESIKTIKEVEKNVIALYYYEQLTLKEIGKILDISESRVSQIHTKVILTLRNKITDYLGTKILTNK